MQQAGHGTQPFLTVSVCLSHPPNFSLYFSILFLHNSENNSIALNRPHNMSRTLNITVEKVLKLSIYGHKPFCLVSRRISQLAENIVETLKEWINRCAAYSLPLDENTYVNDTAQLVVFIRGVTDTSEINEIF